jgi:hypothetical protein
MGLMVALCLLIVPAMGAIAQAVDPLPSWANGDTKQTIKQFILDVTDESGASYVAPANRIAVFDNDGTLWSERPWVQGLFLQQQLRNASKRHPRLSGVQPYKAAMENDRGYFDSGGTRAMSVAIRNIMAELTREEYDAEVAEFFAAARHPDLHVPFRQTVFQPAKELLAYLRTNGFKTFICSGGSVDFMRVISNDFYGIPPDQVIGSSYRKELHNVNGKWVLVPTSELNSFNNKEQKAVNIDLHIGQRPLLVMGNAGGKGDIAMMNYSQGRAGPSLQLLIDHNDDVREFAYAEDDNASLNAAEENGWVVVSMKDDWSVIYSSGEK